VGNEKWLSRQKKWFSGQKKWFTAAVQVLLFEWHRNIQRTPGARTSHKEMNGTRLNINKTVSSLVARFSRCFGKITIGGGYLAATTLDVVETTESVTHFEQIATIGRLG